MTSQSKAIHPHLPENEANMVHTRECLRSSQIIYELNTGRDVTEQEKMEFMGLKAYFELVERHLRAFTRLAEMLSMPVEHLVSIFSQFLQCSSFAKSGKILGL
jgi:hypothetical protein